jgi:hypothetical protein
MMMVAVLALSLYSSMSVAFKAKKAAHLAVMPIRAVGFATDMISKDLDSLVPPPNATLSALETMTELYLLNRSFMGGFDGSGDSSAAWMQFCTIGTEGSSSTPLSEGVHKVEILLDSSRNPPALVRRVTRNLLNPSEQEPEEEVLCDNIRSFSLTFYDETGLDYQEWDSTLLDPVSLPSSIQMELVLDVPGLNLPSEQPDTYRLSRLIPIASTQPLPE